MDYLVIRTNPFIFFWDKKQEADIMPPFYERNSWGREKEVTGLVIWWILKQYLGILGTAYEDNFCSYSNFQQCLLSLSLKLTLMLLFW